MIITYMQSLSLRVWILRENLQIYMKTCRAIDKNALLRAICPSRLSFRPFLVPMAISEFSFFPSSHWSFLCWEMNDGWCWIFKGLKESNEVDPSTMECELATAQGSHCVSQLAYTSHDMPQIQEALLPSLYSKLLPFFHNLALTLIGFYIFMACDAMMLKSVKN